MDENEELDEEMPRYYVRELYAGKQCRVCSKPATQYLVSADRQRWSYFCNAHGKEYNGE